MSDAPLGAALLSLSMLVLTGLAAWRGSWEVARVSAKATIVMALAVLPMGIVAIGFETLTMEPGTPRYHAMIDSGTGDVLRASWLAVPVLFVGVFFWSRASKRLRRRGDT